MHFIELPKRNGDYTFSNIDNPNYFGDATDMGKKRGKKSNKKGNNGFNDPYEDGYNNQWPTPNQQNNQQPYQQQNNQQPYQQQNNQQPYQQQNNQQPYQQQNNQQPYQQPNNQQSYQQPNNQQPNNRHTVESILADVNGHNYNYNNENENDYEYEEDEYELEYHDEQMDETMPLTYSKPDVVDTNEDSNSLIITREFFIAELQPENVTKAHEYNRGVGFQANLNDYEKNNFNIDGIDVNVDSNNIQLAITEDGGDSDIFITVTEEFTNVVVNKENLETSFALFKDDEDEKNKVIIRKKQLG